MTTGNDFTLLWLQAGSCGGCTMSVLERGGAGWLEELRRFGVRLLWHPSLSEETGEEARAILGRVERGEERLDALLIEGSVLRGPEGTGRFDMLAGTGRSMFDWVRALAPRADYCVAVGSCAAFGGVPAGAPDPTDACGLQFSATEIGGALGADFRSRSGLPVVNISGCAPHPGWIMETVAALALRCFTAADIDAFGRPRLFADHLAHHGCSRNEFYEFKASAEDVFERGCLMEHLGCKATQAVGDCNQRAWNGGGSCTQAGSTCIACTSPGFEATRGFHHTPKIGGIPVGLPLDMPKAWFVALAALSKSATPARVRENARSDRVARGPAPGAEKRAGAEKKK
ncbi:MULTISPECIES: NADH ubiquinone dehydrogenase [Methylosinus]|uniref:hydrogenase (acceptor) n=1 Tax=Methylosinus trichosporium (strain ATCC 35070 / NCIMB 11131 / UNIQEM 75 / OB3b) TaxID=595536 RepID=A0A2D2CWG9_METT3|nr:MULTISPECIES: NADH ubiquinone dehydrogenase [Methylosinus]ATQ67053.1 HupU protein [Methylosinus trichosporium OB3b]OBS50853.1 HupU protein [Methylosinus sp. 3S-1]